MSTLIEKINKMWSNHTVEFYTAKTVATVWMHLTKNTLSEIN